MIPSILEGDGAGDNGSVRTDVSEWGHLLHGLCAFFCQAHQAVAVAPAGFPASGKVLHCLGGLFQLVGFLGLR